MYTNTHSLPIVMLLIAIAIAVFSHDAQIDNAFMVSLANPSVAADYNNGPIRIVPNSQHAHFENSLFPGSVTELNSPDAIAQPFNKDDKKYLPRQRLALSVTGNEYQLPKI
jgi:hypothetical protein